ncbi:MULTISPECIES: TetR/AcrR family transcriptional regulator [Vibrio]|uniref:TetR/AcrR family transcriptional regulator n=2 Tax=Vibrio mediterranei TaxID=689 RepID=A0A3G4VD17_9VIBR|nr:MULTISPECIES: TetR/AcrR family transcriptional regulator [Vibrio]AYV22657.1 TetR/AcrR family transcriptional regulator [Vibrio mediterranei]MCG9625772.1 TetR/AcrR family transcriptional regulator [Vibrio mediterranei]MDA0108025.1 TetR/AcrR family transcriptional regulator [Vibrio sp. La 4.2.2]NOH26990.1 TetR/AcrR family transcriptional regulator [Vibrio mediterranei]NUW72126.1 TetR/AcrR family transcriptional regulator [Vibrio mediterranei]
MSKIEQNREKKRRAIMEGAQSIFLSEGYSMASMDAVASKAGVTKQTLYRYFPSKMDLFDATLRFIGESNNAQFSYYLKEPDTTHALLEFGYAFVRFHFSNDHLATLRLLIAEQAQAPEIVDRFFALGSDESDEQLKQFFETRFGVQNAGTLVDLWTGMLLAPRMSILLGRQDMDESEIRVHVASATTLLLDAIIENRECSKGN